MNLVEATEGRLGEAKTPRRKLLIQALIGTKGIEGEHIKKTRLSLGLKSMAGPNPAFSGRTLGLPDLLGRDVLTKLIPKTHSLLLKTPVSYQDIARIRN